MNRIKQFPLDNYFTLVIALILYAILFLYNSQTAVKVIERGIFEIQTLFIPILFAIAAGGMVNAILKEQMPEIFKRRNCLISSCTTGSLLPPCPFIAWPIIRSFRRAGLGLSGTLTMLAAASTVEFFQLFAGLAIFGLKIVVLRISFAFFSVLFVGFLLSVLLNKNWNYRKFIGHFEKLNM